MTRLPYAELLIVNREMPQTPAKRSTCRCFTRRLRMRKSLPSDIARWVQPVTKVLEFSRRVPARDLAARRSIAHSFSDDALRPRGRPRAVQPGKARGSGASPNVRERGRERSRIFFTRWPPDALCGRPTASGSSTMANTYCPTCFL